jgi:hypothetical protein
MNRMKELILKILVQESLDLELWMKRYGILKFQAIFVDFSEAKVLSGNIFFKFQGTNCEIRNCGLIFEKPRVFFAKLSGIIDFRILFLKKTRGPSPRVRGPRPASFHSGPRRYNRERGGAPTEVWCAGAMAHHRLSRGVEEGEGNAAVPGVASSETGWR